MTRRVGWLLTEIERQADGRMSDLARCELVAEVADHLDAAIQARMEMGIDADEAERQAVKEFGPPKAYVKDLLRIHRPVASKDIWKGDKAVMRVFWVGSSAGLIWSLSAPKDFNAFYFFGWVAVFLIAFSVASFRSRCFRPLPLAKASFAAYLITTFGLTLTWHNLWVHGGTGVLPDWVSTTYVDQDAKNMAVLKADRDLLRAGVLAHRDPLQVVNSQTSDLMLTAPVFNARLAYTLPSGFVDPDNDNRITLRRVDTLKEANSEWQYAGMHYLARIENAEDRYRDEVNAINQARSSWLFDDFRQNLIDTIGLFPFLFLFTSFFNAIFGWLGWLASRYRVVKRGRAA